MAHLLNATRWALVLTLLAGCRGTAPEPSIADPADPIELGRLYVSSQAYRRSVLERSLVNPDNEYSALRLEEYAVPGGWDDLDVWAPTVVPLTVGGDAEPVSDWSVEWTHEGLMAAGKRAFSNFPMRTDPRLEPLRGAKTPTAGFWLDPATGRVGGLVQVKDELAWTCTTCHARTDANGVLELRAPNSDIDIAELYRLGGRNNTIVDGWRPGTLDPSNDDTDNPSTIGDLRAVRYQSHLHWAGTVRNSLAALTMRVETLLIVSRATNRPPREVAFAIAYYLWSSTAKPQADGSELFDTNCGTCHHADGSVGPPLPWVVDVHPARGTGYHRTPSLVGVGDRGRLLHDGSIASLTDLLDSGPSWHRYGHNLESAQREELAQWVARHFGSDPSPLDPTPTQRQ